MEVGCNTYSLKGCARTEAFAQIRDLGFHGVELWIGHARVSLAEAPSIAAEAREHGLALRAFCVGGLFGLLPADAERRVAHGLDFAAALGVDLVVGIVDRAAVPVVDRLCRHRGMRFAIENHWYAAFARPADYALLADCSPAVGVNIDTGHFAFLGCDLVRVADALARHTFNVHLKVIRPPGTIDRLVRRMRRQYTMEPGIPGRDDRLGPFVSALRRNGYDGMLSIENESAGAPVAELERLRARGADLAVAAAEESR